MSRYLITGGSGFTGINLIRFLLAKGHTIRSLDLLPFDYPEKDRIEWIVGDVRNKEDVDSAMKDIDIVVHLAMALPLYPEHDILTTGIDGTHTVLESALEHGVDRMIHISSTAVYGIPDHHPLLETDKLVGVGPYGHAKIEAEKLCEAYRKKGLCVPVIRPKSFIGPERLGVFALFYDWAKDGKNFPMIGSGNNKYQLMDVSDLCDLIELTATKDKVIVNDTFNAGGKEFTTMKEDYQAVLDKAGFGKKIIGFPAAPMVWALRLLNVFHLSPLYPWVYETAGKDSFVSIEKAEKILGFAPKYSNKQALVRNYEWYLANMNKFGEASGVTHRVPWKQGLLRIAKIFF